MITRPLKRCAEDWHLPELARGSPSLPPKIHSSAATLFQTCAHSTALKSPRKQGPTPCNLAQAKAACPEACARPRRGPEVPERPKLDPLGPTDRDTDFSRSHCRCLPSRPVFPELLHPRRRCSYGQHVPVSGFESYNDWLGNEPPSAAFNCVPCVQGAQKTSVSKHAWMLWI